VASEKDPYPRFDDAREGPVNLKCDASPACCLLVAALFLGFMAFSATMGVAVMFIGFGVANELAESPGLGVAVLFLLFDLAVIVLFVYAVLALFVPTPLVTADTDHVRAGETLSVEWRFQNRGLPSDLRVFLEGTESATYTVGTSSSTSTNVFFREELYQSDVPDVIAAGEIRVKIPADAMHTFLGEHNKITWNLRLQGRMSWRPRLNASYTILVCPG
jgi:hypothetical protein